MSARPPVNDWATDFDHLDPRWVEDPYPIWDELRDKCPVAHTERFRGVYFPSRYEDVRAIAYDTEHFSSRRIVVRETRRRASRRRRSPPIRPSTGRQRTCCCPRSRPTRSSTTKPRTRDICRKLIDAVHRQGPLRCGGRLRAGYSGAGHRRDARGSGGRGRPLPQLDPRDPRGRHHRSGRADAGDRRDHEYFRPRSRSAAPRRPTT